MGRLTGRTNLIFGGPSSLPFLSDSSTRVEGAPEACKNSLSQPPSLPAPSFTVHTHSIILLYRLRRCHHDIPSRPAGEPAIPMLFAARFPRGMPPTQYRTLTFADGISARPPSAPAFDDRSPLLPVPLSLFEVSYATFPTTVTDDLLKPTKYGGKYVVTLIPGDGIGIETANAVRTVFKADNVPVEFEQIDVSGLEEGRKNAEILFKECIASLKRNKVGLKDPDLTVLGIVYTPVDRSGHASFNVGLRQELDIYASVVLIKNIPGLQTRHQNVDFCIIRENTEGEYSGLEHQSVPGVVESLKIITRAKSERIARFAFNFAKANSRKKVTVIHKANIMKLADGLFRSTFQEIAQEYPTLQTNDLIVDNASMQAVSKPQQFDVLVMPNLYGGILSNIGAGLVGGPGVVPGCNMGREHAVFEPGCRHVGLDIKGQDRANPTAMLLSGAMMLRHLGLDQHAGRISQAVYSVIAEGKVRTPDMHGTNTTHEFTNEILRKMDEIA
ncbi:hypothetical protein Dda_5645 [Drechslerella dactyloides]|uniref:Isocitrate dehydrogenase [NAD] subunit 1, mitochondrial n=1 Tax=Drechslerella dactyloides TaxID=74499 RepID=A0AAD6IWG5_DREDA|nr:hypothetical protein Dda_5645 [Drechslerella dactyloides]